MKKVTEATKKIRNIENTVKKNNIRLDIIGQTTEWISNQEKKNKPITHLHGASLPADKAYFENGFYHAINNSPFLHHKPAVSFDCAEKEKSIATKAMKALPPNCNVLKGEFKDLLKKEIVRDSGAIFIKGKKPTKINTVNFAWADYCCPANMTLVNDFADMIINNMKSGLAYLTVGGYNRGKGGRKTIIKRFARYAIDKESTDALRINSGIIDAINAKLKNSKKNIKCIYNVIYGGGKHGITTMMTIGFSVNLPANMVTLIEDYRQGQDQIDGRVVRMSAYLSGKRAWTQKVRKQRKTKGRKLSPERKAEIKAIEKARRAIKKKIAVRMKRGWDNKKIAEELNLKVGSVGSMVAWLNPEGKLFKKKVK